MNLSAKNLSDDHKSTVSAQAMAEQAEERSALYRLLATLFRSQPDLKTLRTLRSPELREALGEAGMTLPESFLEAEIEPLANELAVAFTDLFLLPGSLISPHESVQIKGGSGLLRGPETAAVRDYYEHVGFQVNESTPMEPDHISIEIEFLGHLAAAEAVAWAETHSVQALDAMRYQLDFLGRHLGRWVYSFLDRVAVRTENDFYSQWASLTAALLHEQQTQLPLLISEIESAHAAS